MDTRRNSFMNGSSVRIKQSQLQGLALLCCDGLLTRQRLLYTILAG
jgi:hypothetical protein